VEEPAVASLKQLVKAIEQITKTQQQMLELVKTTNARINGLADRVEALENEKILRG
jgi:hypothetical protein